MTDSIREIDSALAGKEPIAKDKVLSWLASVHDLPGMAKLYRLTASITTEFSLNLAKQHRAQP